MIPYDIDPSLHCVERHEPWLDDGFAPRAHGESPEPAYPGSATSLEEALASKSDF